jgi:hypothetical protein
MNGHSIAWHFLSELARIAERIDFHDKTCIAEHARLDKCWSEKVEITD